MSLCQPVGSVGSIKDTIYLEKLNQLKAQLESIINETHPDYVQGKAAIEEAFEQRLFFNDVSHTLHKIRIETEYKKVKAAAVREFEEKKCDVKESLLNELEEKKRQLEMEYLAMDLTGDGSEPKQPKRNLRRRFNEPVPFNDKKPRKASPSLNLLLSEADIEEDMKKIYAATGGRTYVSDDSHNSSTSSSNKRQDKPISSSSVPSYDKQRVDKPYFVMLSDKRQDKPVSSVSALSDASSAASSSSSSRGCSIIGSRLSSNVIRSTVSNNKVSNNNEPIDSNVTLEQQILPQNGKLLYQKRWYLRGQVVSVDTPEMGKVSAIIQTIGHREIGFRTVGENKRFSVPLYLLQQGKATIKKRSS